MPIKNTRIQIDDQRKDNIDPKERKPRNRFKQLQTNNLTTDDMGNVNITNKGRDLQLAIKLRFVLWGTERMPQMIQRYIDQHILNENNIRRKNLAMAWFHNKNAYDMVPHR